MANLRPRDTAEIFCQIPGEPKTHELAHTLVNYALHAFAVRIDGQPVAAFGVSYLSAAAVSVWAFGTKRMRRAVPSITRHVRGVIVPDLIADGYRTMEARSMVGYVEAHRWMLSTGAVQADLPYVFGKNGEEFVTFRWTAESYAGTNREKET